MKNIQIESNMELPPRGAGRKPKLPLNEIGIGDGITIPLSEANERAIRSSVYGYSRRHGVKFETRKQGDVVKIKRIA